MVSTDNPMPRAPTFRAYELVWGWLNTTSGPALLLLLLAVTQLTLDRYPQWDEAVFLSQISGLDGAEAPPAAFGPSREIGSAWKLSLLAWLGGDYATVRLLHIALVMAVLAYASDALARVTRVPAGVYVLVLGSYWLTLVYTGQLLRFTALTFVLVAAVARYLLLLQKESSSPREAVLVGALFAVGLILGPFETAVTLIGTGVHWLIVGRGWRAPRPGLVAGATIAAISLVVHVLDTRARYGSLGGRLEALQERGLSTQQAFGWELLDDYLRVMFVNPVSNGPYWMPDGVLPRLAFATAGALFLLGLVGIFRGLVHLVLRRTVDPLVSLVMLTYPGAMFFLAAFFDVQSDRYLILPATLLLVVGLVTLRDIALPMVGGAEIGADGPAGFRRKVVMTVAGVTLFVATNAAAAGTIDDGWTEGATNLEVLTLVRDAVDGRNCNGVARYNSPAVQWTTGCHTAYALTFEEAVASVRTAPGDIAFVFWPSRDIPEEQWAELRAEGWYPLLAYPDGRTPVWRVLFRP